MENYYNIVNPDPNPPTPSDKNTSWLHDNIVLVIVVGVVGFMILAAVLYCLCCKAGKKGYHNALYDDDDSMKARI